MLLHVLFKTQPAVGMHPASLSGSQPPEGLLSSACLSTSQKSWSLFFFMLTNSIQHKQLWWQRSRARDGAPCRAGGSWRHRSPPPPASVASAAQRRAGTRYRQRDTNIFLTVVRNSVVAVTVFLTRSEMKMKGLTDLLFGDHFHQRVNFFDRAPEPLN